MPIFRTMSGKDTDMDIFPYDYRPGQRELVGFIDRCLRSGDRPVIEAGTGTGKTVSSLCGAIPFALEKGKKIIYLTRTKSQQRQVVREASAIRADVMCVAVQGRSLVTCPLMRDDPELRSGTPEEISKLCAEYKRMDGGRCHCRYYNNLGSAQLDQWVGRIKSESMDAETFAEAAEKCGLCPYELLKLILPYADILVIPYSFIFMKQVFRHFQSWLGLQISDMVIIVDEAHNIPDYLRDVQTYECSRVSLERAVSEAEKYGDPGLYDDVKVSDFIRALGNLMDCAIDEYLVDEDGMLPPGFIEEGLMQELHRTSVDVGRMLTAMEDLGDSIEEHKKQIRKLPRTYIGAVARFVRNWMDSDDGYHVHLIIMGKNPKFQAYCLDPRPVAEPLNDCCSSIHMSGTLEPLDSYMEELGLSNPVKLRMPSCFDEDNMLSIYTDKVTMRFDERFTEPNYGDMQQLIVNLVNCVHVNTAIFFPSFQVMDRMIHDGLHRKLGREVFFEKRSMSQDELMESFEDFSVSEGSVLFCVTGGRISEGLDFPHRALEMVLIVGVPYAKPTVKNRALQRYYDLRFGNGYAFVSSIPAARRMRQAAGRLIRTETDIGVAVVLDRRVAGLDGYVAEHSSDPVGDTVDFFMRKGRFRLKAL